MQRVNLHARPSIIQVGCPACCYQVCPLDHAKGGTADLDYHSEPYHRNDFEPAAGNFVVPIDMYQLKILSDPRPDSSIIYDTSPLDFRQSHFAALAIRLSTVQDKVWMHLYKQLQYKVVAKQPYNRGQR